MRLSLDFELWILISALLLLQSAHVSSQPALPPNQVLHLERQSGGYVELPPVITITAEDRQRLSGEVLKILQKNSMSREQLMAGASSLVAREVEVPAGKN